MTILPGSVIGIIGDGQLGKMMIIAATQMGYKTLVFSNKKNSPAGFVADDVIVASYLDRKAWSFFKDACDIATYEWENVPLAFIEYLEKEHLVRPSAKILHLTQNRIKEKDFIRSLKIETVPYQKVTNKKSFLDAIDIIGLPCILKTCELGYDGRGQYEIVSKNDLDEILEEFGVDEKILEKKIAFQKEISVVAARDAFGQFAFFTPVQNIHKNKILDITIAPADVSNHIKEKTVQITKMIMNEVNYIGVMAVEFFVTEKKILVNEIAPRPHNSGHWTIDACFTSQFEQHIRAICQLKLGDSSYHSKAVMKNLIGDDILYWQEFVYSDKCKLHVYGKDEIKAERKMGHLTTLL